MSSSDTHFVSGIWVESWYRLLRICVVESVSWDIGFVLVWIWIRLRRGRLFILLMLPVLTEEPRWWAREHAVCLWHNGVLSQTIMNSWHLWLNGVHHLLPALQLFTQEHGVYQMEAKLTVSYWMQFKMYIDTYSDEVASLTRNLCDTGKTLNFVPFTLFPVQSFLSNYKWSTCSLELYLYRTTS
jgi:hypothetical protein